MEQFLRTPMAGPLAGWAAELVGYLADQGYAEASVADHLRCLKMMSTRLDSEVLEPAVIDEGWIEDLAETLHRAGRGKRFTPVKCRVVLRFLRSRGVVPCPATIPPTALEALLGDYRQYLVVERALAPMTLPNYLYVTAWFLTEACDGDPGRIGALSAGDVSSFVLPWPRSAARRRSTPWWSVCGRCCGGSMRRG